MELARTITHVKSLADRLKFARELRDLTQGQLAAKAKCAQGTIGNVEAGTRKSMRNLVTVARALEVSAEWLSEGKGPAPQKKALGVEEPTRPYRVWPFSVDFDRYDRISPAQKALIDQSLRAAVEAWEADNPTKPASGKHPRAA